MSHYHLIPIEAKQLFSSILVVFKIKLRKLCYTGYLQNCLLRVCFAYPIYVITMVVCKHHDKLEWYCYGKTYFNYTTYSCLRSIDRLGNLQIYKLECGVFFANENHAITFLSDTCFRKNKLGTG